jgi:hypothetical protein
MRGLTKLPDHLSRKSEFVINFNCECCFWFGHGGFLGLLSMGFFVCFAVLVVACFGQQNHSEGLRFLREFWTSLNGAAWQYPAVAPDESQWFYGGSEDYCSFWGVHCSDNVTISVIALDNMNLQG